MTTLFLRFLDFSFLMTYFDVMKIGSEAESALQCMLRIRSVFMVERLQPRVLKLFTEKEHSL